LAAILQVVETLKSLSWVPLFAASRPYTTRPKVLRQLVRRVISEPRHSTRLHYPRKRTRHDVRVPPRKRVYLAHLDPLTRRSECLQRTVGGHSPNSTQQGELPCNGVV
jgi:hypothetical protein